MAFKRKPPPGSARRVISLGNNFRGVTTNKRGRLVQFESEQERKLVLLLEHDPTVADYISQPETLRFCDGSGRKRHYTPDFKVWRTNGHIELHEVTLEARRQERGAIREREAAARAICQQRGWSYIVHTDQTLPSGYEHANMNFLAAFRASEYTSAACTRFWLEQLAGCEMVHPRTALNQAKSGLLVGELFNALYHQLWHGVVQMDWQRPFIWQGDFHSEARIWLPITPTSTTQMQGVRS